MSRGILGCHNLGCEWCLVASGQYSTMHSQPQTTKFSSKHHKGWHEEPNLAYLLKRALRHVFVRALFYPKTTYQRYVSYSLDF
jgi:hypothetical protein